MPAKKCFRLDKEKRLFPGPNHPGQKHQEKPICFPYIGRLICRRRMISWCRRSAFSAISSDFPLVKIG